MSIAIYERLHISVNDDLPSCAIVVMFDVRMVEFKRKEKVPRLN
jgi:hypothetical protein